MKNSDYISFEDFQKESLEILKDELNVKEIIFGEEINLNTEITEELKEEGNYREFLRSVQDLRKKEGLVPSDMINVFIETNEEGKNLINKFEAEFICQIDYGYGYCLLVFKFLKLDFFSA